MLRLIEREPLAEGFHRRVYAHPDAADRLVKVMRPDVVASRWNAPGRWYKRLARARQYTGYVRELKEYIAVRARSNAPDIPIAPVHGLVDTDLGLGLVVERIRGPGGGLAPTLDARVQREGLSADILRELDALLARLLRDGVILGDLHPWNIVWGEDAAGPRFMLIDGFGEKNVIPRCSMSQALNRHNTRRLYRRLLERVRGMAGPS